MRVKAVSGGSGGCGGGGGTKEKTMVTTFTSRQLILMLCSNPECLVSLERDRSVAISKLDFFI